MARTSFAEGFLTDLSSGLSNAHLKGVECNACGVHLLGERNYCEHCGSNELKDITLSNSGEVFSYTIQRYSPPGEVELGCSGDDWEPRAVAYVDHSDGARVLGIIEEGIDDLAIGDPVEVVIDEGWETDQGDTVCYYKYQRIDS